MRFLQFLTEGIRTNDFERAVSNIVSYLSRQIGTMYPMHELEHFSGPSGSGVGLRYFLADGRSIRFNWTKASASSTLQSITLWVGNDKKPSFVITGIDGAPLGSVSLATILPTLVNTIKNPVVGPVEMPVQESAAIIAENVRQLLHEDPYDDVINAIQNGPVSSYTFSKLGRNQGRIFDTILSKYKHLFSVKTDAAGRQRYSLMGEVELFDRDAIVNHAVGAASRNRAVFQVNPGGSEESFIGPEQEIESKFPNAPERIPFEEQLEDVKTITASVVKGASNFCIILGGGGIGKTHTVEQMLADMGLEDGNGYFKNSGSGSAVGLFKRLFMNRTGVLLLDDSDAIVATQEGRNILKAALDTKKRRKITWGKSGSWLFEPTDEMEMENALQAVEAGEEPEKYPRYYDYEGRVIMISNLSREQLDPDGALSTRGFLITLNPTNDEIFEFMKKIVNTIEVEGELTPEQRQEVLEVIKKQQGGANLRKLVRGLNMAATGVPNWQRVVARYG